MVLRLTAAWRRHSAPTLHVALVPGRVGRSHVDRASAPTPDRRQQHAFSHPFSRGRVPVTPSDTVVWCTSPAS